MTAGEVGNFGALLRSLRKAAGLTQEELAERASLSRRGINDLERGARLTPRSETVALLANALGLAGVDRAAFLAAARRVVPTPSPPGLMGSFPPPAPSIVPPTAPARQTLPGGTVTFLFTDIAGSTQLLQRLGTAYADALGEHQTLLRAAFGAYGGVEVDTQGDAFFVAFPSAPAAVAAAAAATRALAAHPWPEGDALRVRIGLHTGTPQMVGDHYVGLDVHRAARIASAGHGGQVLVSQATRELVEQELPPGSTLKELGQYRLKDLQQPERLSQLILPDPDLPADFPPLKTLDAHSHNLPLQPTPLLGREAQLAALAALLGRGDVRLVTLTGPGGIGKTRLAAQVAADLIEAFPDGVWYVRLSRLSDPGLVVPTIAQVLGLKEEGSQPIVAILRAYLADKRLLLVLDNFEQVIVAASDLAALLESNPRLRVLVTSRQSLHLRGERVFPLAPLPLPDPHHLTGPGELTQYAAVALFVERAQAAKPDFAVTTANAPAIAEICAWLDGLPLAIELAATRVRVLPPEALLARLPAAIKLLTGGARDAEERQRTMRATLAWSEGLLEPDGAALFRRLAVFVGGATLEATEAVCAAPEGAAPLAVDMLDGLDALVDQSLVQQREEGGEPRFGMLHIIREYALERLAAADVSAGRPREAEALRQAHAAYFLALAERADPELVGPEAGAWLARLEGEHDNLRAALGWAREQGEAGAEIGLRLVAALGRFWVFRGHLREGRAWAEALLALVAGPGAWRGATPAMGDMREMGAIGTAAGTTQTVPAEVRARAFLSGGGVALWQGDYDAVECWLGQAAALARAAGDRRTAARALNSLGAAAQRQGNPERATTHYEESLGLMREVGDHWGSALVLNNLGDLAVYQGDLERAAAAIGEALALFRQVGDRGNTAVCLENLGWVARKQGQLVPAAALQREALALFWEVGDLRQCAEALEYLAGTAGVADPAGRGEWAARLLGVAAALRETVGALQPVNERADVEQAVAAARAALGEDAWAAAFAAGRALSLEEAIAEALETAHDHVPQPGTNHDEGDHRVA